MLGPVRIAGRAGPVVLPARKTREVLVLLALAAPRPLSVTRLAEALWDEPPPSAVKTVQAHVSRVRAARRRPGARGGAGYVLDLGPDELDVLAVAEACRTARIAALDGDDAAAGAHYRRAEELWRGEPELPATVAGDAERARTAEERIGLAEAALAAAVASGDAAAAVGRLAELTARHPLHEELWDLRIKALYACGRQSDALAAYREARRVLVDEAGVEPGPALRATAAAVLRPQPGAAGRRDRRLAPTGGRRRSPLRHGGRRARRLRRVRQQWPRRAADQLDVHPGGRVPGGATARRRRRRAGRRAARARLRPSRCRALRSGTAGGVEAWAQDAVAVLDAACADARPRAGQRRHRHDRAPAGGHSS